MSDIFREVDEAMSREKAAAFWKNYGPTLVLAAVILVLSTAVTTAYRHWDSSANKEETAKLIAAIESPDMVIAMTEAAKDTRGPHKAIALLSAANSAATQKDFAAASDLYKQVSEDNGAPDDLQDLATILYARSIQLTDTDAKEDIQALLDKLLPVAKNEKSAFQAQAKIEAALLYGSQFKDYTKALDLLKGMDKQTSSDSLTEKATALTHVYQYELSKTASQE